MLISGRCLGQRLMDDERAEPCGPPGAHQQIFVTCGLVAGEGRFHGSSLGGGYDSRVAAFQAAGTVKSASPYGHGLPTARLVVGALTEYLSWRWTLYVKLFFAGVALASPGRSGGRAASGASWPMGCR